MRIECINSAETDRYLSALFISEENNSSENTEAMEQDEIKKLDTAVEECIEIHEVEADILVTVENNDSVEENKEPEAVTENIAETVDAVENGFSDFEEKSNDSVNEKQKVTVSTNATSVPQTNAINQHFEKNGYIVVESSKPQAIAGLKNLTYQIGENYAYTAPLLKEARKAVCAPNEKGDRNLYFKFDKCAGSFYHQFSNILKQYGLFTKYFINRNILTATISNVPRVTGYFTGQWLEMYLTYILEEVVSEYAKANDYKYEILMNIKVSDITSINIYAHEIDCVISVADKCFAFEVKSGQFDDYSAIYNTRKELHFVPDRYLLLSINLEEEVADTLQYFYEFYITGMNGFKKRLIEMIDKAFAN